LEAISSSSSLFFFKPLVAASDSIYRRRIGLESPLVSLNFFLSTHTKRKLFREEEDISFFFFFFLKLTNSDDIFSFPVQVEKRQPVICWTNQEIMSLFIERSGGSLSPASGSSSPLSLAIRR
jgi:hypothetical protein